MHGVVKQSFYNTLFHCLPKMPLSILVFSGRQETGFSFLSVCYHLDILRLSMPSSHCGMDLEVVVWDSDICQELPRCAN